MFTTLTRTASLGALAAAALTFAPQSASALNSKYQCDRQACSRLLGNASTIGLVATY